MFLPVLFVDNNLIYVWQPDDWDDKEYIPDPEDKKPEVKILKFSKSTVLQRKLFV